MRFASTPLILSLIIACAPAEEEAQPAGPTLADFAGTWEVSSMLAGVADTVHSTLAGTADPSSWTMTLGGMDPIPLQVSIIGDSLIAQSGQYMSILREGVPVTVRVAGVLQNDMLVGTVLASYQIAADSVERVMGTTMGMRAGSSMQH